MGKDDPRAKSVAIATALAQALKRAGSSVVFGVPGGGSSLDLAGAAQSVGMRFVLTRGETAAAIMAGTHAELTGAPGAVLTTCGPGAASALNGAAQAQLDRQPLLVVTDSIGPTTAKRISHQLIDQRAMFAPIVKQSMRVGADRATELADEAVRVALEAPPGVVHIDVAPQEPSEAGSAQALTSSRRQRAELDRLFAESHSPVILLGVGAPDATAAIRSLVEGTACPVVATYKARGVIPESWPNACGLLTGATIEAPVLEAADLIVGIGLDPVELINAPWPYPAPMILLNAWPIETDYFGHDAEVVGALEELAPLVAEIASRGHGAHAHRDDYRARRQHLETESDRLTPYDLVRKSQEAFPDAMFAVDAGAHMLVAKPFLEVDEPREVLISSGLATMGFALPAAIGATLARPGRRVVCLTGDGGIGMALAELETAVRLALPITVVVFNDSALSLIEVKQRPEGHGGTDAVRYGDIDFAATAVACGGGGRRVRTSSELEEALTDAQRRDGVFVVDAAVDPSGYRDVLEVIRGRR
jgi:acetolactate synthase-1/2/3 large subunit